MTAGAEKNATTKACFPQRLSIRWTPPSTRTGTGWKEGGWRNNATATNDDGNDSGVIEDWCQRGGGGR